MHGRDPEQAEIVHTCLREVFRGDAQGQVTFSIVRQLAEKMKARSFHVSPKAVQMWGPRREIKGRFLDLPLREALGENDELGTRAHKKRRLSEV